MLIYLILSLSEKLFPNWLPSKRKTVDSACLANNKKKNFVVIIAGKWKFFTRVLLKVVMRVVWVFMCKKENNVKILSEQKTPGHDTISAQWTLPKLPYHDCAVKIKLFFLILFSHWLNVTLLVILVYNFSLLKISLRQNTSIIKGKFLSNLN
jgi:hypothetical protein